MPRDGQGVGRGERRKIDRYHRSTAAHGTPTRVQRSAFWARSHHQHGPTLCGRASDRREQAERFLVSPMDILDRYEKWTKVRRRADESGDSPLLAVGPRHCVHRLIQGPRGAELRHLEQIAQIERVVRLHLCARMCRLNGVFDRVGRRIATKTEQTSDHDTDRAMAARGDTRPNGSHLVEGEAETDATQNAETREAFRPVERAGLRGVQFGTIPMFSQIWRDGCALLQRLSRFQAAWSALTRRSLGDPGTSSPGDHSTSQTRWCRFAARQGATRPSHLVAAHPSRKTGAVRALLKSVAIRRAQVVRRPNQDWERKRGSSRSNSEK